MYSARLEKVMIMLEFDFGSLRQLRKRKHMKQAEVGRYMHCTGASISKIELGLCRLSVDDLARLANLYEIDDLNVFFVKRLERSN